MILESLPLDTNEHAYFSELGISEADRAAVFRLAPASFHALLQRIAGCEMAIEEGFSHEHWSSKTDRGGCRYPRDSRISLAEWRKEVSRFFAKAFHFGESDEIFLVNVRYIYCMPWSVFLRSWEAFSPFHDSVILVRRDDPQFGIMKEDIDYVGRGNRPPAIGFDSPKRVVAWTDEIIG